MSITRVNSCYHAICLACTSRDTTTWYSVLFFVNYSSNNIHSYQPKSLIISVLLNYSLINLGQYILVIDHYNTQYIFDFSSELAKITHLFGFQKLLSAKLCLRKDIIIIIIVIIIAIIIIIIIIIITIILLLLFSDYVANCFNSGFIPLRSSNKFP